MGREEEDDCNFNFQLMPIFYIYCYLYDYDISFNVVIIKVIFKCYFSSGDIMLSLKKNSVNIKLGRPAD